MDSSQFRQAAHAAVDEIINYYESIEDRRTLSNVEPGYLQKLLPTSAPQTGEPWESIQRDIEGKIMPGLTHWQSPNFMAFFPANATYASMLGELYSAAFTAPAFNWLCSPAVTELETVVLDWLAQAFALPACYLSSSEGGGVIQGSASEAVVTVMVAARDRYLQEKTSHLTVDEKDKEICQLRGKLIALGSEMSHSSTQKAAMIAGVRYRSVPTSIASDFSMTGDALKRTLEQCKREGLEPFFLTATMGTTATCAVDRFDELAAVLQESPLLWVHVDAAYAGSALVCEEYQHHAKHFEAFNSVDINMHKWLLTNFDASCLFVKRRRDLIDALSITPSYLRNGYSDSGLVTDYRDWQIPLGRRFRSLKIWFVMRTYGIQGFKAHIRHHVKLGELFHSLVLSRPDLFSVLTPPAFALTVLSIVPRVHSPKLAAATHSDVEALSNDFVPDASNQAIMEANAVTRDVYELINSRGEIFLTSSMIGGIYSIRVVNGSPQAQESHVRKAFDILVRTTEEVLSSR